MNRPAPKHEIVDRAFETLRAAGGPELPDPRVERRLVALATHAHQNRAMHVRPALRLAAALLLFVVLAGGTVAATVGLEGLRRWWFSIRVGGETVEGTVVGDGQRAFEFTAPDGFAVRVLVERGAVPGAGPAAERTRVGVEEIGPNEISQELYEIVAGASHELWQRRRHPTDRLGASRALHRWTGASGEGHELHLIHAADGAGGWLAVRDLDAAPDVAVRLVQPIARTIGPGGRVEVVERANGSLSIEIDDGRGWACELEIAEADGSEPATEWTTPSGRVHVELGSDD